VLAVAVAGVIPWIPAAPPPPRVPPLAPACRLSQLRVSRADPRLGVFFNGATGSLVGVVTFRNVGTPCSLLGRPRIRLVGRGAGQVRQRQIALPSLGRAADVLPPPFSTRALPRGRLAGVQIWWSNWCGVGNQGGGNLSAPPAGVEVTLPSGGTARLRVVRVPRCDRPAEPSRVAVRPFEPVVPQPNRSTRLPFRLSFDRASYRVRVGERLHYLVTLTSTSRQAFRFRSCPLYFEQLGSLAWHEIHYLNCRPAGSFAPSAGAVFAIELGVPRRTRPGRYGLLFELGLGTYQLVQTPAPRVIVTPN
jgi:hypothetical protein